MADARYSLHQRLLHWIIAVLVLLALIAGAFLWAYGFEGLRNTFGATIAGAFYKYHKTAGVLILGLMILRVSVRLSLGAPAPVATLTATERILSTWVQRLLYVALIAMPVVGWLATAAGDFPVQFFDMTLPGLIGENRELSESLFAVHTALGLSIVMLAGLHVAGGLRHWLIKRDGVMRRMSLFG